MTGEYLSIDTTNKIAKLEKENKEMSDIIIKYDKEVNRLYGIIKKLSDYFKKNPKLMNNPVLFDFMLEVQNENSK